MPVFRAPHPFGTFPPRDARSVVRPFPWLAALLVSLPACEGEPHTGGITNEETPTPEGTSTLEPGLTPTATPDIIEETERPETPTPTPVPVSEAEPGDVVITELMINPRGAFDVEGEWFELTNRTSDATFDLNGWKITHADGSSHTISIEGGLRIGPGEIRVLGRSSEPALNGNVVMSYVYDGSLLSNTGQGGISVSNAQGIIDTVAYDLEGGYPSLEGHSLTLDPAFTDANDNDQASSWCVSFLSLVRSGDFGTPGGDNEVCGTDEDADAYPVDRDCDDAEPQINPSQAEVAGNSADDDCDGEIDEAPSFPTGALLITEILYNPGGLEDRSGEWFEILNTTTGSISLKGWSLGDADETHYISESTVVPPATRILLGLNPTAASNGGVFISYAYTGFLLDDADGPDGSPADTLRLIYNNIVVDQVTYGKNLGFPVADGATLSLSEDARDPALNDLGSSWCLSYTEYGSGGDYGTPGSANSRCRADADGDGYNEVLDCDDNNPNVHPDALEVPNNQIDDDCDGSIDELTPVSGAVIITELMIDTSAVSDGDGEYIELFNRSETAIDINGWVLRDDAVDRHVILSSGPLLIQPESYLVLGINGDVTFNGNVDLDYEYGYDFKLDNDFDEVILEDGNVIIDQVLYDERSDWYIPKGRSLGLDASAYDAFLNDVPSNWCQAITAIPPGTGTDKGTPGLPNDSCDL